MGTSICLAGRFVSAGGSAPRERTVTDGAAAPHGCTAQLGFYPGGLRVGMAAACGSLDFIPGALMATAGTSAWPCVWEWWPGTLSDGGCGEGGRSHGGGGSGVEVLEPPVPLPGLRPGC
eukprot:5921212-Prymnesium_polylepis.2